MKKMLRKKITHLLLLFSILLTSACATAPKIGLLLNENQALDLEQGKTVLPYVQAAITRAGGKIVPLSPGKTTPETLRTLKGLVLPGGDDVVPEFYGEKLRPVTEDMDKKFDEFEFSTLKSAKENRIPILGICRGLQVLNVFYGGSLYQDIPTDLKTAHPVIHRRKVNGKSIPTDHSIRIQENTLLQKVLGTQLKTLEVNTYHHQGIKKLGDHLRASAVSEDGLVEAIESTSEPFVLGVQYHPEKDDGSRSDYKAIFDYFLGEARKDSH